MFSSCAGVTDRLCVCGTVAFNVFDYDGDGFISNADAYRVCRMLIPSIPDLELQRLVDRVLIEADNDRDGMLSFDEFSQVCPSCFAPPAHTRSANTGVCENSS